MIFLQAEEIAIVLDTSAVIRGLTFIEGLNGADKVVRTERIFLFLPHSVVEETKYESTKVQLNLLSDRITVIKAGRKYLDQAMKIAAKVGLKSELSETDLEVIALALELKERYKRVYVATDDARIQNACVFSGIEVIGFKKRIKYLLLRIKKCSVCEFEFDSDTNECPSCGSEKFRYIVRKIKLPSH